MSYYHRRYRRRRDPGIEKAVLSYIFLTPLIGIALIYPPMFFIVIIGFGLISASVDKKIPSRKKRAYKSSKKSSNSKKYISRGEQKLFEIVKTQYPNEKIIRNYRPNWIKSDLGNNLELDIYLPNKKLAFEFQGEQHKVAIPHWGGEEKLQRQKRHDAIKRETCPKKGITLIEVWFDEPLNSASVNKKIRDSYLKNGNISKKRENKMIQTNQSLKLNNVVPIDKKKISNEGFVLEAIGEKAATNLTNKNGSLPCLTCGFSICRQEYHYGA